MVKPSQRTVIPRQAQRRRGRRQKETPFHDGRATQLERRAVVAVVDVPAAVGVFAVVADEVHSGHGHGHDLPRLSRNCERSSRTVPWKK
jgi:hypothetical protein